MRGEPGADMLPKSRGPPPVQGGGSRGQRVGPAASGESLPNAFTKGAACGPVRQAV